MTIDATSVIDGAVIGLAVPVPADIETTLHRIFAAYDHRWAQRLKEETLRLTEERISILRNIQGNTRDIAALVARCERVESFARDTVVRVERLFRKLEATPVKRKTARKKPALKRPRRRV